jgi:predicted phosphodiesterase
MKIAIFSDIHGNLEALDAVLADAASQGATEYACLGDIVNHNSNPSECIRRLRELGCPVVKGNHDEEAAADTDISTLNPAARTALEWTRRALSDGDKAWLRALPMVHQAGEITIVHSTLDTPTSWAYVMNEFDAMASFAHQFTRLCFFGHTHTPKVFIKGQTVTVGNTKSTHLEPGLQYFINVGSVGQPRDGDWRSAYAVYDHDNQEVSIRRVPYDTGTTQRKNRRRFKP